MACATVRRHGGRLPPEPGPSNVPRKFARYEVERELGKGAMGVVFLGRDPVIGRRVALKTIRAAGEDDSETREFTERFLREAQAAGTLSHPNPRVTLVRQVAATASCFDSSSRMRASEGNLPCRYRVGGG